MTIAMSERVAILMTQLINLPKILWGLVLATLTGQSFNQNRRTVFSPAEFDRPLNRAELAERQRRLSMLSPVHVADAYRRAHEACQMTGDRLPKAADVQEMVTAWKLMWELARRGPVGRISNHASMDASWRGCRYRAERSLVGP